MTLSRKLTFYKRCTANRSLGEPKNCFWETQRIDRAFGDTLIRRAESNSLTKQTRKFLSYCFDHRKFELAQNSGWGLHPSLVPKPVFSLGHNQQSMTSANFCRSSIGLAQSKYATVFGSWTYYQRKSDYYEVLLLGNA